MSIFAGKDPIWTARRGAVSAGLVGHWDSMALSAADRMGNIWYDISGNNNHGTLTNGASFDRIGVNFDGVNDFTDFAFSQAHNPDYVTATAWVLVTGSGTRRIVTKPRQAGLAQSYSLVILSSGFATWIANTATLEGAGSLVSGSVNLTNAGWTHLAGTWDGTTSRLFVNGTQVNTVTGSGVITYSPTSNLPLQIGRFDATVGQYYSGSVNDIRIYNRALSNAEILRNFNATRARFGV